jgi:hypothetical protein
MAHELTITNGKAEMAFVGETPWHGLGQQLKEDSTIEDWQFQAGMDWTINSAPVNYVAGGNNQTFVGQNVLYRSDNSMPLAVVSNRYKAVQPKEVLEFFRDLVAENGFKIHTAGTLRGGKRMWALAETGKFGEVCKDDGVGGFLLLSTSCDRTLATTARFTTVRVVCNNTLTAAVNYDVANKVSFSHIQHFNHEVVFYIEPSRPIQFVGRLKQILFVEVFAARHLPQNTRGNARVQIGRVAHRPIAIKTHAAIGQFNGLGFNHRQLIGQQLF